MTTDNLEDRAITENDDPDDLEAEVGEAEVDEAEVDEAETEVEEAADDGLDTPPRPSGAARPSRRLHLVLAGLAVLLLVASVFTWWRASNHDADLVERAELRDHVLITATSAIETMNSLDYRDVAGSLKSWEDVTTGTLHDQIVGTTEEDKQLLADQQKVSTGKVKQSAVVDLTDATATVIAAVEVTVRDDTDPEAEPTVKRNRFAADLVKVGDTWLLETLEQVAVNMS